MCTFYPVLKEAGKIARHREALASLRGKFRGPAHREHDAPLVDTLSSIEENQRTNQKTVRMTAVGEGAPMIETGKQKKGEREGESKLPKG